MRDYVRVSHSQYSTAVELVVAVLRDGRQITRLDREWLSLGVKVRCLRLRL